MFTAATQHSCYLHWSGKRDSNSQPSAWKADALPIELFPRTNIHMRSWSVFTRNLACSVVEGGGFEPPKASPTDLQSVPFGRSGTPPRNRSQKQESRSQNNAFWFLSSGFRFLAWSWRWDLNPQPADYKSAALPIELRQR